MSSPAPRQRRHRPYQATVPTVPSPTAAAAIRELRVLTGQMLAVPGRLVDQADRVAVSSALASIVSAAAPVDGLPSLNAQVAGARGDVWHEAYAAGAGMSQAQIARHAGVSQVSVHRVVAQKPTD